MSINKVLFESIYNNCLRTIENTDNLYIKQKEARLKSSYIELKKYEDSDLQEFYSIVHELRVYEYLKKLSFKVDVADDTKAGPDFSTQLGYIECVSATKGEKGTLARKYFDKIQQGSMNRYEALLPRLTSVILDKSRKIKDYLNKNIIESNKPCIIAVGASVLANANRDDLILELMLRILYGIGYQIISFNPLSSQFADDGIEKHTFQDKGTKQPLDISLELNCFGNPDYKHISGVILNNNSIGQEIEKKYFCLLLNPLAVNPIDTSLLQQIKFFSMTGIDENGINYKWHNC